MFWPTSTDLATMLRRTLSGAEIAAADQVLAGVISRVEQEAGRPLVTATNDTATLDGHGRSAELLPEWPVTAVHSVAVTSYAGDGTPTVTTLTEHVDFEWSTAGVLTATSGKAAGSGSCGGAWAGRSRAVSTVARWPNRPRTITVVYDHGPDAEMTALLSSVVLGAAVRSFYNPESLVAVADGSGGFTAGHTMTAGSLTDDEKGLVRAYRSPRV